MLWKTGKGTFSKVLNCHMSADNIAVGTAQWGVLLNAGKKLKLFMLLGYKFLYYCLNLGTNNYIDMKLTKKCPIEILFCQKVDLD